MVLESPSKDVELAITELFHRYSFLHKLIFEETKEDNEEEIFEEQNEEESFEDKTFDEENKDETLEKENEDETCGRFWKIILFTLCFL